MVESYRSVTKGSGSPIKPQSQIVAQLERDYKEFKRTKTFRFPTWLLGAPKGKLVRVEVEDCPRFNDTAYVEFDSARTAFVSVDMQKDFCGPKGYVDVMGYELELTAAPIKPIRKVLETLRSGTDVKVIHTREGHPPNLFDAPYNKLLRSKIIGGGVGIGDVPQGGLGRLLIQGEKNWDIVEELYPKHGEYVIDKPGKGAFGTSAFDIILRNLDITHLIISGVTTDVCVHSVMREANDRGFWCVLLKDCTAATDYDNYLAAIKQIKMSGGIFGWVSDSTRFIRAIRTAFKGS